MFNDDSLTYLVYTLHQTLNIVQQYGTKICNDRNLDFLEVTWWRAMDIAMLELVLEMQHVVMQGDPAFNSEQH